MCSAQQVKRLTFEWVSRTDDSDLLRIVMGVGSLWIFPSTESITTN
jgi:hypothetical protein